ncbi:MAG TPA: alpha/beta hydrolase [Bacteroidota bacterium]|nr:alpha/beta hydrolase [Bacteroidota bacterium]
MKKTIFLLNLILFCGLIYSQETKDSFQSCDLSIEVEAGKIFGTLLIPNTTTPVPIALIISGSGPTDRDGNQTNMKNNSLRYLAEILTKNGIATLRYDKRLIGQSKTGQSESEIRFEDYISDAKKWISTLKKDSRFSKIIVIGHSEGSLIGMIAAYDSKADMFISIAGVSKSADQIILEQTKGLPTDLYNETINVLDSLRNGKTVSNVNPNLAMLFRPSVQPYMISWIKFDPSKEIQKLEIPVLIIQGTTDIQVSVDNARELASSNNQAEMKVIENMNHILKISEMDRNKNIATYMNPDLPISDDLTKTITNFINEKIKNGHNTQYSQ